MLASDADITKPRNIATMVCGAIVGACTSLIKTFIEGDVVRTAAKATSDAAKAKFAADTAKVAPTPISGGTEK